MCRSKNERDGGKRCPKESNPEAKAARNQKRREAYAKMKVDQVAPTVNEPLDFLPMGATRVLTRDIKKLVKESQREVSHLTEEQADAILRFTDNEYKRINQALYSQRFGSPSKTDFASLAEDTQLLDAAFLNAPLKERITYKGANMFQSRFKNTTLEHYVAQKYAVGSEVVFDGYQSTTLNPTLGAGWAGNHGIIFEMKTRSGINISSKSKYDNESEVLVPRSSRWKIVSVENYDSYKADSMNLSIKGLREVKDVTVVKMIEIGENGQPLTERIAPQSLTVGKIP